MSKVKEEWKNRFFTPEEIAEMESAFNDRFCDDLQRDENISFEGSYEDGVCYLTLILKNEEETFYYPVETAISSKENLTLNSEEARLVLLDFIGAYFDDYFASQRETFVPIDWALYQLNQLKLYARGQVLNKKLECMANSILESAGYDSDGCKVDEKKKEDK